MQIQLPLFLAGLFVAVAVSHVDAKHLTHDVARTARTSCEALKQEAVYQIRLENQSIDVLRATLENARAARLESYRRTHDRYDKVTAERHLASIRELDSLRYAQAAPADCGSIK